ncbi:MAG TPA: LacI family DNA-binding transcriptional regulator [Spirochaetia bacterium]|nr:LacI family DNA-binding transcriptional regulator [Spirochaetia bacterium]
MTIKDIASRANVSVSTVSRCLNDSPLVARETKQRIVDIARDADFQFNANARGLSKSQVGTIAIILPDDYDKFNVYFYHSALHNHLRRSLEREDVDLIVGFSRNRFSHVDNIRKLVGSKKVDGLILVTPGIPRDTERFLKSENMPYVFSHYPPPSARSDVDRVYVDHHKGGMSVGELMANNGYRRVIGFHDRGAPPEFEQRLEGLKIGFSMADHELELREVEATSSFESGFELATDPVRGLHEADAIFGLNDLMAMGVVYGLQSRGVRVPADVAVVGYDDTPLAGMIVPRLTTVRQPSEEIAFLTCERLLEVIRDRQRGVPHVPRHIALQPQLIIRETCPAQGGAGG